MIVPVHNAAAYLPECLDALAAQRFDDFRCILVDDGSTDASAELCDEAAQNDRRFLVIHQPQSGVSAARTAGVRKARAEGAIWLAFCDADDRYHPDFLRTLHAAAQDAALPWPVAATIPLPIPFLWKPQPRRIPGTDRTGPSGGAASRPRRGLRPVEQIVCRRSADRAMLDNDLAYNEDLLANWQAFCGHRAVLSVILPGTITASMQTVPATVLCRPKALTTSAVPRL